MGSRQAEAYLSSPAVVAASAAAGFICGPATLAATLQASEAVEAGAAAVEATLAAQQQPSGTARRVRSDVSPPAAVSITDGFEPTLRGPIVFCAQDDINTDGIFAGEPLLPTTRVNTRSNPDDVFSDSRIRTPVPLDVPPTTREGTVLLPTRAPPHDRGHMSVCLSLPALQVRTPTSMTCRVRRWLPY